MVDEPGTAGGDDLATSRDTDDGVRRRAICAALILILIALALLLLRCQAQNNPPVQVVRRPQSLLPAETSEPPTLGAPVLPATVVVPNVVGMQDTVGRTVITDAGLGITATWISAGQPRGQIIQQNPNAGVEVDAGTLVEITVSLGLSGGGSASGPIVPDVLGMSDADARSTLAAAGWSAKFVDAPSTTVPRGLVFYQKPGAGTPDTGSHSITVWVSTGSPPPFPFPMPE